MKHTLYELTGAFKELYEIDLEETGLDQESWFDTLEGLEGEINEKAENVAVVYKQLLADVESFKAEKLKLQARQKSLENKAEYLKRYLVNMLTAAGKKTIEGTKARITITKGTERTIIDNPEMLKDLAIIWKPYKWEEENISKTELKLLLEAESKKTDLPEEEKIKGARIIREPGILIK